MTGLTRVVLIACLFGVLKGATWMVEGQHALRMISAVQSDRLHETSPKLLEVLEVAMLALGNSVSPGALSDAERDARDDIRHGLWLLMASVVVAGAVFVLPGRGRPRGLR